MNNYTKEELEEALRAIASTISKCEKVLPKLKEGTSQHTLLIRRIKALHKLKKQDNYMLTVGQQSVIIILTGGQ